MPLTPEKLAAILAAAQAAASKKVPDPTSSENSEKQEKPVLDRKPLQSTNSLSGSTGPATTATTQTSAAPLSGSHQQTSAPESVANALIQSSTTTSQSSPSSSTKEVNNLLPTMRLSSEQSPNSPATASVVAQALTSNEVAYPGLFELSEKIIGLDKALQANHPEFHNLLGIIHRNLDKDAKLLHLLKPEDVQTIFRGLKKHTQTVIVEETVKSAGSGRNRGLKNIGMDDL